MEKIAFFGIGLMGLPISLNLLNAGYSVSTVSHTPSNPKLKEFVDNGGEVCDNFEQALKEAKYILSILTNDAAVEQFYKNKNFIDYIEENSIILEMTSCSSKVIDNILPMYNEKNVTIIDGPVSGGVIGAKEGTLTIMCSGEKEKYEKLLPILSIIGKKYDLLSEKAGVGKEIKAINQMLVATYKQASAEAIMLSKHLGLDLNLVSDVISSSSGNHAQLKRDFSTMPLQKDPDIFFTLENMTKDVNIAFSFFALPLKTSIFI